MTGPTDSPGDKFISLLDNEFITQNVWKPTFKQANGTFKNVLDYILTDKPERISNISIGEPLGSARQVHLSITFNVIVDSIPCRKFCSKNFVYGKGDYEKLNTNMNKIYLVNKFSNLNMNQTYEAFLCEYNKQCETVIL